ncbi:cingulin-like protein 1 [Chanos chanos]|uniref:Cingulin-like protein 1 n=1 Tax=Chanos chanos TaxID=29144 RepID=A0A6J2VG09_CHACN|nr:cingulin-like protein 1 [Chanos chanos]
MESNRVTGSQDDCLQDCKTPGSHGEGTESFGVKIRVQGIDGRPYVVLNNQGKMSLPPGYPDVFYTDLQHSPNSHSGALSQNSLFMEHWSPRSMQLSSSPTERRRTMKNPSSPLLNYQRRPELLRPYDPVTNNLDVENYRSHDPRRLSPHSSPMSISPVTVKRARIPLPAVGNDRAPNQPQSPGYASETLPSQPSHIVCRMTVPYVNELSTNGPESLRGGASPRIGRVGHRLRMGPEQRRRSRSVDGPSSADHIRPGLSLGDLRGEAEGVVSAPSSPHIRAVAARQNRTDTIDGVETRSGTSIPQADAGSNSQRVGQAPQKTEKNTLSKSIQHTGVQSSSERDTQVTPDLLKGQRQLAEQPDEDTTKLVLFSYLKDGNTESDDITKRKVDLMFEKIHMLRSLAAENVEEFSDSANEVKELQEKRAALEAQVTELKQKLEEEMKRGQTMAEECEKKEAGMKRLQEELSTSEQEHVRLRQKLTDMEKELQTSLDQLLQAKRQREQYRADMRDLQSQLSDMHDELDNAKITDAGERDTILKDLVQLRQDFQELQQIQEEQEEMLYKRERELTALRGALEEEVTAHAKAVEDLREQHQREVEELRRVTEEAKEGIAVLSKEKAEVEAEKGACQAQVSELMRTKELLSNQIQTLEARITALNHIISDARTHENKLREKMEQLKEENQQLEEELAEVRQQEDDLCGANRAITRHLEDTQFELTKLNHEHRELKERLKEESRQIEELKRRKAELENERRLQDRVMEQLQEEMTEVVVESERATQRLQVQIDEVRDQSVRELAELRKQLQEKTEELERHRHASEAVQKELSSLDEELSRTKRELGEAQLKCKQLEKRVEELQEMNRATLEDKDRQIKLMEMRVGQLEQDLAEEHNSGDLLIQRMERGKEQVEQVRVELLQERAARQDLECERITLERQNKDLKSRVAHLEGSQKSSQDGLVSKLEGRIQELEERLLGEERDNNNLQQANRKLERKVKELMLQVDEEQLSLQNQRDQLTLRLKALKRQLDEAEEEIERLEHSKKKLQRELDEQQESNDQLQSQLSALRTDMRRKKKPPSLLRSEDDEEEGDISSS